MTDREILELLLKKIDTLENEISEIKSDMATHDDVHRVKRQLIESTAKLKAMDEMILDEVERVHNILDRHKTDKTIHSA